MSKEVIDIFLKLVRIGIGHDEYPHIPMSTDWDGVKKLADDHGLTAIVLDGLDKCHTDTTESTDMLPLQMKLEWIGEVLQNFEQRYVQYEKAIGSLAGFYNQHGYKMMVLKGYACSLDWPKPEHRPCGDIDIWQFGQWKDADAALAEEKGVKVDGTHHHHTMFDWQGFSVENHYDFINVHHHKSNVGIEKILKEQANDESRSVEVEGEKVYLPSPNLHALFLLKHTMMHFAAEGVSLRLLLDWGFFVEKHHHEVDWEWLLNVLDEFGMTRMFNILNAICVGDLGFDVKMFPTVRFEPLLKVRVLKEILSPEFDEDLPKEVIHRVIFKLRRWKGSSWKHELCYNDSMWSAFWSGVWNHILKPSSI